ncbi:MAG TPA: hypothetical protein VHE10_01550 [Candidatus Paceibacterota bacterium]|nr:hypothetical protein [Candidatus Paceibacterota bacterium]
MTREPSVTGASAELRMLPENIAESPETREWIGRSVTVTGLFEMIQDLEMKISLFAGNVAPETGYATIPTAKPTAEAHARSIERKEADLCDIIMRFNGLELY